MQYHALALAVNETDVDLVGLAGVPPMPDVAAHPRIRCHVLADVPAAQPGPRYRVRALARLAWQSLRLGLTLALLPRADLVLVQTPPSLPVGPLAWLRARLTGARFVLDWHNLGWTVLALKTGPTPAVDWLRRAEARLAAHADGHLAVSRALAAHLAEGHGVRAAVVYDRPDAWMTPCDAATRARMREELCRPHGLSPDDAVVLVSPTSWTPDEDLDLLLAAADELDRRTLPAGFPPVLCLVSGQGPGRAAFEARLARRPRGARVAMGTVWVEPSRYPALLASADAGVCLHRSSSGLDLPMKVADMFGVGVPVLAFSYPALAERLADGEAGRLFVDGRDLADLVVELWSEESRATARALAEGSARAGGERWLDAWTRDARPTLERSAHS